MALFKNLRTSVEEHDRNKLADFCASIPGAIPINEVSPRQYASVVGEITSGALSPTLGHPIALAYVDGDRSPIGTHLFIDVRGTRIPATVTEPPFYRRKK